MPANLTPIYYAAYERYKKASNDRERLKALKEMLSVIPKHKGTDKLQGDLKRKIARLKVDQQDKKSKKSKPFSYSIDKEGAGQITIVGPPNVGKSQLVNILSGATFEVADFPFTTRLFQPSMMVYEDIQVQLVDLPPVSDEYMEKWVPQLIKNSNGSVIVFDMSRDDLLDQVESTINCLNAFKIKLESDPLVKEDYKWHYISSLFIGNKMDLPHAKENLSICNEFYGEHFSITPFSALNQGDIASLRNKIVKLLNIVRIYSKRPGHPPEMEKPFILSNGKTLKDLAEVVHKDFAKNLTFAKIWGENKFDGQRITKDYVLEDKDIIELHM